MVKYPDRFPSLKEAREYVRQIRHSHEVAGHGLMFLTLTGLLDAVIPKLVQKGGNPNASEDIDCDSKA